MHPRKKIQLHGLSPMQARSGPDWDEAFRGISWWDVEKIHQAKVMVVGAGALGNEVLKNLALLNVGYILIVDFDHIEYVNLSRSILFRESDCGSPKAQVAAERIKSINPNVQVQVLHGDIGFDVGLGIFRSMDVVIGCLDNRLARLYINRHCYKVGKTWVDGGIENLAGRMDVFKPYVTCYECLLDDDSWKSIQFREGCTDIAVRNGNFGRIPTTPISASVIGALQTQEALKVIFNNHAQSAVGQRFFFEGMNNMFLQYEVLPLKGLCGSHVTFSTIIELDELSANLSVADALSHLEDYFSSENIRILLDYEIVFELQGSISSTFFPVIIPKFRISDVFLKQFEVQPGEKFTIPSGKTISHIDRNFSAPQLTLSHLGVPPLHILTVEVDESLHFVELRGDASYLRFAD